MKKFDWRALYLCGFWLLISSCGGTDGRSTQPQPLMITSAVLPQAVLREAYAGNTGFSLTATGGMAPYSWSWKGADGSTLPPGLKLSSNLDGSGTILGTPTKTGPYGVIVTVTDSESPTRQESKTYIITVAISTLHSHEVTPGSPRSGPSRNLENSGLQSAHVPPAKEYEKSAG